MRAAVVANQGIELKEIDRPQAAVDQVLVRVRAAALNRADLAVVSGGRHGSHGGPGTIPGMEWAGEVVDIGQGVSGFKAGDRVMCSGMGAYAEYAVTDIGRVMHIPDASMTWEQAATLPVALQTMHNALITAGRMKRGESVLIQGASSGVGLMALKIARLMGAGTVIGTSSNPQRRAQLSQFGADLALDNSDPEWPKQALDATGGRGVDLIIDQLAGPFGTPNLQACAVLGRIVNVGRLAGRFAEFDFDLHALKRIDYIGVTFRTRSIEEVRAITTAAMADLAEPLRSGQLVLPIDSRFELARIADAFTHMRANRHFGKIVVTMPD